MKYSITNIAGIIHATAAIVTDSTIEQVVLDSRKIYSPAVAVFFAMESERRNGHQFIPALYKKGVRNFVAKEKIDPAAFKDANFLFVVNTLDALQQLATYHRQQFNIPVIGITGSNGKTIVKEWLNQLLQEEYNIVRSPKSYNSQIGVPLSVLQMSPQHTLAIFEAGISQPGEMEKLEKIIQPTIGILTNIGEAHSSGFVSPEQKEQEKKVLFKNAKQPAPLEILNIEVQTPYTLIEARKPGEKDIIFKIEIPFNDEAAIQNVITCWQLMLMLDYKADIINKRVKKLLPVDMRLELKKGINHCTIINDSYSADISSLEIALNFLLQQSGKTNKTVILSDFLQSATPATELYTQVIESLQKHSVNRFIGIGEKISNALSSYVSNPETDFSVQLFPGTDAFLQQFLSSQFKEETILVKGARIFAFEKIVQVLEQQVHQTVLEINLNAIVHNLKSYQQLLKPGTKIMAMVKAFAYGSGAAEIAGILQYHHVDYLGVAYADEGIALRKAGIMLPVMVMNPDINAFDAIVENNLEPELYSFELLHAFDNFLKSEGIQQYPVHIEIETGMNRLGFNLDEIALLGNFFDTNESIHVQSVFTHLAAADTVEEDLFTKQQYEIFKTATGFLQEKLGYNFLKHISNSAAAIRFPDLELNMVRLGIGLYGIDSALSGKLNLQPVATLKSTVAQVKKLKAGESVSYNRSAVMHQDAVIATIRLGYADGYPRRLGNGMGKVFINGKFASITGNICMDMFMADITEIPGVKVGDEVILFGDALPVQQVAIWAGTIPYEIMTGISQRVKRVYYEE